MVNYQRNASKYISENKGFMCPDCSRNVVAGYDYCPNCGAMPEYDQPGTSNDNDILFILFWFVFFFLAPFVHWLAKFRHDFFSMLVFLPAIIMLVSSTRGLFLIIKKIKLNFEKKSKGFQVEKIKLLKIITRIWVFYFSLKTILIITHRI
ncbi:hypothetical protein ERUR111494_06800 [Erysipelothrix urinaevulpis]|uniref:hypothetical protein n=1 Tax=Erysipelothrix urinaevulpis TaxID=2683717 RepID=UPI001356F366|nr:hypothetical protein [Erysipelothrix urinaevulpis]